MSDTPLTDAARFMRLLDGFVTTQLLYVAAKLGVATLLAERPTATDELAAVVGVDAGLLHRVLRGLALEGVVDERDDGRFALTGLGEQLIALEATALNPSTVSASSSTDASAGPPVVTSAVTNATTIVVR